MNNFKRVWLYTGLLSVLFLGGCASLSTEVSSLPSSTQQQLKVTKTVMSSTEQIPVETVDSPVTQTEPAEMVPPSTPPMEDTLPASQAEVLSIKVSGETGAYNFLVTVSSPDTGCDQYADWWEVISQDGELLYRRILLHSHVNEQPFTRSGGPVPIESDTIVLVRAHMHPGGYGSLAMKGSLDQGFEQVELSDDFAADLAERLPLPEDCDF
jgi:hypothetical protein